MYKTTLDSKEKIEILFIWYQTGSVRRSMVDQVYKTLQADLLACQKK